MNSKKSEVSISGIKPKPPTYSYAVPAKNVVGVPKPDGWKLTTDSSSVATWKAVEQELNPQTDLIVLLREEVTLMQRYLEEQNLREHFVAWRQEK